MSGKEECGRKDAEYDAVARLLEAEDLIVKKARIYSRLLTDVSLSEDMEAIAVRGEERMQRLAKLVGTGR